jgi:hypothetical protein
MSELPADWGLRLAPLLQRAGSVIESEIRGPSMAGTLPDGARIRIACRGEGEFPTGTVLAFVTPMGLIGHRIVAVGRAGKGVPLYFTRGDGAVVCDGPIEVSRVLGVITEWFDGAAWRSVPAAPAMPAARRIVAGTVLSLTRIVALASLSWSGRLSRLLLRVANRYRSGDGTPPAP